MNNFVHQLAGVTGYQMMSYVIVTSDHKTVIIDGGYQSDFEYLAGYIEKHTGSRRVDAWILTHPHDDHASALIEMVQKHPDALDVGTYYYNFPDASYIDKYCYDKSESIWIKLFNSIEPLIAAKTVTPHEGDRITVGALEIDVLHEPDTSVTSNVVNNASLLLKMRLGEHTLLITGDLGVEGGNEALSKYRAELKSDVVEMAHHGQNGVDFSFYEAVKPDICLWPTPQWLWDNNAGNGYDTHSWKTIVVRGWMERLGVKRNIVSKDGDAVLEL